MNISTSSAANTTKLDQIAGTGDSAKFTSVEFPSLDKNGASTGYLTETAGGDGVFRLDVASFAPTSNGYPIIGAGYDLLFKQINYKVDALGGYLDVGAIPERDQPNTDPAAEFAFTPALTATPAASIWDGTDYVADDPDGITNTEGAKNITINAIKRINVTLDNDSSTADVAGLELIPRMEILGDDGITPSDKISWAEVNIEDTATDELVPLTFTTDTPTADSTWNDLTGLAGSTINPSNTVDLRVQGLPVLKLGTEAPNKSNITFETYIGYDVSGQHVRHKSEIFESPVSEEPPDLISPTIEIDGKVFVRGQASSLQASLGQSSTLQASLLQASLSQASSNLKEARQRLKADMAKATKAFLNANENQACHGDPITHKLEITTTAQFGTTGCAFQKGQIIYVDGADVTLGDGIVDPLTGRVSDLTLPKGANTLIIRGGNLNIRSNLQYDHTGDTFGMIVLKTTGSDSRWSVPR